MGLHSNISRQYLKQIAHLQIPLTNIHVHTIIVYTYMVEGGNCMKNITLGADEDLIESARDRARSVNF